MTYLERADTHARAGDAENLRSIRISRWRLATFLPGAACVVWLLSVRPSVPLAVLGALLFSAFAVLVVWHARVDARIAWLDALRVVNLRAHARILRDWSALPAAEPPVGMDLTHHPYAVDLDLFGRASLMQWLGPSATPMGSSCLSSWLLDGTSISEIEMRQAAVRELAPAETWREAFFAHGVLASGAHPADLERFLGWAEGGAVFGAHERLWRLAIYALTSSIWILIAMHAAGLVDVAFWLSPMAIGIVVSFVMARRMYDMFNRAGAGQRALSCYAGLFAQAVAAPSGSMSLRRLQDRLSAGGVSAPQCMHQLNRILGFAELRASAGIFHFLIQALNLWDFHVAFALERWRRTAGHHVRAWMESVGQLDALGSLAGVSFDNPSWCMPTFTPTPALVASGIAHPLLPDDRRVANDLEIGPPGTVLLITGSNMSGKSTLLRAVGLNVVLAGAGGAACASAFRLPACDLQASIRVQDSLELGLSYFMAALARLKGIVDAAEKPGDGRFVLYLLDEILQGTNSAERSIAVRGVVHHLLEAGAIGALTTHDLSLAAAPPLDQAARLVHFSETVGDHGTMSFDYRLRPGLATSRNALRLMQLIGIDLPPPKT